MTAILRAPDGHAPTLIQLLPYWGDGVVHPGFPEPRRKCGHTAYPSRGPWRTCTRARGHRGDHAQIVWRLADHDNGARPVVRATWAKDDDT